MKSEGNDELPVLGEIEKSRQERQGVVEAMLEGQLGLVMSPLGATVKWIDEGVSRMLEGAEKVGLWRNAAGKFRTTNGQKRTTNKYRALFLPAQSKLAASTEQDPRRPTVAEGYPYSGPNGLRWVQRISSDVVV